MPINARPEYFKAEKKYHEASTTQEKIVAMEEVLRTAPSHKSSENLRAELKQRLAKLRSQLEKSRQVGKGKGTQITVKREGAAQVILASITNAGKSSLLAALTNAKPTIAAYEYTTKKPEFGIMGYEGVNIQLVEMPAIFYSYAYKGDGPAYFSIMRNADLIIFLVDTTQNEREQLRVLHSEFEKAQIRLNAEQPKVTIKREGQGGIELIGKNFFQFDPKDAIKMLTAYGYHNGVVTAHGQVTIEDLADALNESLVYLPLLVVKTKADVTGEGVSAKTGRGLQQLKEKIFKALRLIRVCSKSPGKEKDWPPIALKEGSTVKMLAAVIHKDFLKRFKFARVWGKSAKHNGQKVGMEHKLKDNDVVEFHLK